MKPKVRAFVHASTFAIAATGIAWAWMAYVWDPGPEPMDPELMLDWSDRHALEPITRTLHLLAAPLSVFAVGSIWMSHVAPRLTRKWERRATGLSLALLFAPMVLSGVLLQTASSDEARRVWVWVHCVSAAVWVLAYAVHQVSGRRARVGGSG